MISLDSLSPKNLSNKWLISFFLKTFLSKGDNYWVNELNIQHFKIYICKLNTPTRCKKRKRTKLFTRICHRWKYSNILRNEYNYRLENLIKVFTKKKQSGIVFKHLLTKRTSTKNFLCPFLNWMSYVSENQTPNKIFNYYDY